LEQEFCDLRITHSKGNPFFKNGRVGHLADGEPVRPTRRKKRNHAINLVKMSVVAWRTVFPRTARCRPLRQAGRPPLHFQTVSNGFPAVPTGFILDPIRLEQKI
jgi:hypothetical protein